MKKGINLAEIQLLDIRPRDNKATRLDYLLIIEYEVVAQQSAVVVQTEYANIVNGPFLERHI